MHLGLGCQFIDLGMDAHGHASKFVAQRAGTAAVLLVGLLTFFLWLCSSQRRQLWQLPEASVADSLNKLGTHHSRHWCLHQD